MGEAKDLSGFEWPLRKDRAMYYQNVDVNDMKDEVSLFVPNDSHNSENMISN